MMPWLPWVHVLMLQRPAWYPRAGMLASCVQGACLSCICPLQEAQLHFCEFFWIMIAWLHSIATWNVEVRLHMRFAHSWDKDINNDSRNCMDGNRKNRKCEQGNSSQLVASEVARPTGWQRLDLHISGNRWNDGWNDGFSVFQVFSRRKSRCFEKHFRRTNHRRIRNWTAGEHSMALRGCCLWMLDILI